MCILTQNHMLDGAVNCPAYTATCFINKQTWSIVSTLNLRCDIIMVCYETWNNLSEWLSGTTVKKPVHCSLYTTAECHDRPIRIEYSRKQRKSALHKAKFNYDAVRIASQQPWRKFTTQEANQKRQKAFTMKTLKNNCIVLQGIRRGSGQRCCLYQSFQQWHRILLRAVWGNWMGHLWKCL